MMRGLALRLEGVLQSWGGSAAGDNRPTHEVPTRSGVVGLVGAALGVDRRDVAALAALDRGLGLVVRVDRPGTIGVDYHTAMDVPAMDGERGKDTVVTKRKYLQDASFVALLIEREGLAPSLEAIANSLRYPRFTLSLGRRACVPGVPLLEGREVLTGASWEALLAQVGGGPRGASARDGGDVYVDEALFHEDDRRVVRRRLKLRDRLVGPLPRTFLERSVVHVGPRSRAEVDTIEGWMP